MSLNPPQPEVIFLDLAWPQFAMVAVTKIQSQVVQYYSEKKDWPDEFVARQSVRECFSQLCPGLSIQEREAPYPNSAQRLDLMLGKNHPLNFAVEIKSDPENIAGVKDDWEKICDAGEKYKLVIFAGACSKHRYELIEPHFDKKDYLLGNGHNVHEINAQMTMFGEPSNRRCAFIWIWSVGTPLPKGYELRLIT